MLLVTDIFLSTSKSKGVENQLLKAVRLQLTHAKRTQKLKKAIINIDLEDLSLQKYFCKRGELTAIELLGKVSDGLHYLLEIKTDKKFKIRLLEKNDISKCIKLDIESHIKDSASRMRDRFKLPGALGFQ